MTKPKLLPSLCKQMSIVFDITPEVLSGALRRDIERQEDFIHSVNDAVKAAQT